MTEAANTIDGEHLEIKAEISIDGAGSVTGIAWPFGSPDSIGDVIEPTAFRFASKVPMILEHEQREVVGIWENMEVTDKGLEVKGTLFVEGVAPARAARQRLRSGILSGLSIGYQLHQAKPRPEGGRVLTDLTITEISLCRRPVHPSARVTEVKSIVEENHMENEIKNAPEAEADPVVTVEEFKAPEGSPGLGRSQGEPPARRKQQSSGSGQRQRRSEGFFRLCPLWRYKRSEGAWLYRTLDGRDSRTGTGRILDPRKGR